MLIFTKKEIMPIPESQYIIRQFSPEDVEQYKFMRLEALRQERGVFGNSYENEAAFPREQWIARLVNPKGAYFGLYCDDELIGITGVIVTDEEKPDEAYMTHSYIRKEYRGKGCSRILYEARLEWAKKHQIKCLKIGHRASNLVSKAANQHYGFTYTHSEPRTWPDGQTEDMLYYELALQ
jgi:RimJ/RimL family protein N-acetyltransferase